MRELPISAFFLKQNSQPKCNSGYGLPFFASFAVKLPMWPFHRWLPEAHVEAPTGGSVILAAILLKMGGYGFLRFSLPMFPDASAYFADFVFWLSIAAIIFTSLIALVQRGYQKADRLFLGCSYGLCDHRYFFGKYLWGPGGNLSDDFPRHRFRRAVSWRLA